MNRPGSAEPRISTEFSFSLYKIFEDRLYIEITSWPKSFFIFLFNAIDFLYIFELCIRASVILGLVGAGGVGRIIETQRIFLRFDRISPIIVLILIAVIAIEQFSVWLRRKIL